MDARTIGYVGGYLPLTLRTRATRLSYFCVSSARLRHGISTPVLVIIVLAVISGATVSALIVYGGFAGHRAQGSGLSCSSLNGVEPPTGIAESNFSASSAKFIVVESDSAPFEGMNGSYYHTFPSSAGYAGYNSTLQYWPIILVKQGQQVTITVINCASSEPHGFAIGHYFNSGVTVSEGQSFVFTFQASMVGRFNMYCNIFCSIHPYMQNGIVIVS